MSVPAFYLSTFGGGVSRLLRYNNMVLEYSKIIDNLPLFTSVQKIDIQPTTGTIFATVVPSFIGNNISIYTIDPTGVTAQANFVGVTSIPSNIEKASFDFDPVTGLMRYITETQNYTIDPITATSVSLGTMSPQYVRFGAAFTNNYAGSSSTNLYILNDDSGSINLYEAVNDTSSNIVASTTIPIPESSGFDIQTVFNDNFAYGAFLYIGSTLSTDLYTINLVDGSTNMLGSLDGIEADTISIGFTLDLLSVPCLRAETKVLLADGKLTELGDIKRDDLVVDFKGNSVRIVDNALFNSSNEFVFLAKGVIGKNLPQNDMYIRPGQLITEKRTFVMMEGIPVCTWDEESLKKSHYIYKTIS